MIRCARAAWITLLLVSTALPARPAQFKFGDQTLTVPDGFEVERVAAPPLVDRPVTADFDEEGRLYVTESSGSNEKVDKQLQQKPHWIVRLEDSDGDGRFDRKTVFADKMMFPEGCLWFHGSLYVSAPPSIWKLTDTDGDGAADARTEWFQGKTLTGCANDLHGPYAGPDGWIYWCKGAFATQTYERAGQPPFVTRAAHIFRSRPDGTGIEPVLTGGMDNPVSVAFTPDGERILTGTFFVHPGGGQRDGLIHAIYGGVYGKDHDVLNGHKRTGDLMPIMTHHGPSASSFVIRYDSDAWGAEYRDNLFACLFNLHKVMRHVLVPAGATFQTRDEDFLVSDNPDFHPTDLLEDADGSLLVVDTGGWYKICCPTSQLWKPDVLGAIYRVRRKDAQRFEDPRGAKIAWSTADAASLAALLGDARPFVSRRAIDELGQRGSAAVSALQRIIEHAGTAQARRNAVWALTRIDGDAARGAVRLALKDSDLSVRHTAAHSTSLWRDAAAVPALIPLLSQDSPALQRVAAEALGRMGALRAVAPLLRASSTQHDRVLEHSLTYALIELDTPDAVQQYLANEHPSPWTRRAGLIALDQMDHGGLQSESILPLLASPEPVLKQTAYWIAGHHPDWAPALTKVFREQLASVGVADNPKSKIQNPKSDDSARSRPEQENQSSAGDPSSVAPLRRVDGARALPDAEELESKLAELASQPPIQSLLQDAVQSAEFPNAGRLVALRAMGRAGLKEAPAGWTEALTKALSSARDNELRAAAVSTARALNFAPGTGSALAAVLREIGTSGSTPMEVRLEALAAVPGGLKEVDSGTFELLRSNLEGTKPVLLRSLAAGVLAKARLTAEQLGSLTETIKTAGPLEVPKLLAAYEKSREETVGLRLVEALKVSPGLPGLRPEIIQARLTNFPDVVREKAEQLSQLLNADASQQKTHLDELLAALHGGDVRRGQAVFNSQKAACSSCHAIGYLGGNVGPDLTRIGQVRTERDLLESIVYPSASFVRSYEPVVVVTKSGDDYSGVIRKDAPDQLVLATGPNAEVRIARNDIADMRPGTVSVMPAGLDELLSRQELADLVAFLKNTKW